MSFPLDNHSSVSVDSTPFSGSPSHYLSADIPGRPGSLNPAPDNLNSLDMENNKLLHSNSFGPVHTAGEILSSESGALPGLISAVSAASPEIEMDTDYTNNHIDKMNYLNYAHLKKNYLSGIEILDKDFAVYLETSEAFLNNLSEIDSVPSNNPDVSTTLRMKNGFDHNTVDTFMDDDKSVYEAMSIKSERGSISNNYDLADDSTNNNVEFAFDPSDNTTAVFGDSSGFEEFPHDLVKQEEDTLMFKGITNSNRKIPILSLQDNSSRVHKPGYSKTKHVHPRQSNDDWLSFNMLLQDAMNELTEDQKIALLAGQSNVGPQTDEDNQQLQFELESLSSMSQFDSQAEDYPHSELTSLSNHPLDNSIPEDTTKIKDEVSLSSKSSFSEPLASIRDSSSSEPSQDTWQAPCKAYSRVGSPHRSFYYSSILARILFLLKTPHEDSLVTKLAVLARVCEFLIKDVKLTKFEAASRARQVFIQQKSSSNVGAIAAAAAAAIAAGQHDPTDPIPIKTDSDHVETAYDSATCLSTSSSSSSLATSMAPANHNNSSCPKAAKIGSETILRWLDRLETTGTLESDHRGRHSKRTPVLNDQEKEFLKRVFECLPCDRRSAKAVRIVASGMKNGILLERLAAAASGFPSSNSFVLSPSFVVSPSQRQTNGQDHLYTQALAKVLANEYCLKGNLVSGVSVTDKLKISHATACALIAKWGYKSKGHGKKTWYELG